MEQSQFKTLNHSDSLFPFPPHRRRHLKSDTFCTLVRILSHCNGESQRSHSHPVVPQKPPKRGSVENELGQPTQRDVCDEPVGPTSMESEILSIQRGSKVFGSDEFVNEDRMETDEFDHVNRINKELVPENCIKLVNTLDKNPSGNVVSLIDNQEGQASLQEISMEESGKVGQLVVDGCRVIEALDLSLDMDIFAECPKLDENNEQGSSFVERNVLEEVGHEMQLMELEKLVSDCGAMKSLLCVAIDEEIEEGEISGSFGVYDQSMDLLLEDAASLEKMKVDGEQTSEAIINEEQLTSKKQKGANQEDTKSDKNFVETIDNMCDGVELKLKESNMPEMEWESEIVVFGKNGEAKLAHGYDSVMETGINEKQATRAIEEFNDLAMPSKFSGENATENQRTLSTEKDASIRKKKKRGPSTKEKKAKKKQKERIKRAEKNRRLGVKRLKIQPILKPKTVTYCRHYIKGRCQEGDKCKFSHDTIPLTKSKPCCHFARHSCMKGDDCPFDHQLSKYPCNNYLSNSFCSRGPDCMFSHEMPLMEGSPSDTNVSKPELQFSCLLRVTNSEKQVNLHNSSHQKVDSVSGCIAMSSCKNMEQNVVGTILKPAVQTPKGIISKLLFGKSALGNPSKLNKAGSSAIAAGGGVKVGLPMIRDAPDMAQNSNEITKMTAAVESKGINFLSFGKASLHDSSSKKPSCLSFSKDCGIPKSTFGDCSKDKQAASFPKKDDGLKVGHQTGQSARDMVHIWSEMPKRAPAVSPQGINFLSFGKAPSDYSKLVSVASNGDNDVGSSVQERETAPKLQIPSSKPWKQLSSSSLPSDQSLDRLADECGKDAPSSSLRALLSNTPNAAQKAHLSNMTNSAQKALLSTLTFAAKYESRIRMDRPAVSTDFNKESSGSSQNTSRGSTILDFLYGNGSKAKQ